MKLSIDNTSIEVIMREFCSELVIIKENKKDIKIGIHINRNVYLETIEDVDKLLNIYLVEILIGPTTFRVFTDDVKCISIENNEISVIRSNDSELKIKLDRYK